MSTATATETTKTAKSGTKKGGGKKVADSTIPVDPIEIPLDQLVTDKATQCRVSMDDNVISEYAELMTDGMSFPGISVVQDTDKAEPVYYIVDGWHRVSAARKAGFTTIWGYIVGKGDATKAMDFATQANVTHGLRRTNADKRRAVNMALTIDRQIKRERSDREIATALGVHHSLVGDVRAEMDGKPTRSSKRGQKPEGSGETGGEGEATEAPAPSSGKDEAGQSITEPNVVEAIAALPTFDSLIADIKAVQGRVKALAETQPGSALNLTTIDRDLDAARGAIQHAKPYAQCPYGQNKACDDSCKACKGKRWVTEAVWDRIPAAIKAGPDQAPSDAPPDDPS